MTDDLLMDVIARLDMVLEYIERYGDNISAGLQIVIYCFVAFLVWQVIRVVYGLFGRVFFGGV